LTHSKFSAHGRSPALHAAVSPKPHKPYGQQEHASGTRPSGQASRPRTGHRTEAHPSSGHWSGGSAATGTPPTSSPAHPVAANAMVRANELQKRNKESDTRRRHSIIINNINNSKNNKNILNKIPAVTIDCYCSGTWWALRAPRQFLPPRRALSPLNVSNEHATMMIFSVHRWVSHGN